MRNILRANSDFIGNVAILMSGKTIAAVTALVAMPFVARLFTPEDFGIAAVFASITGIVSSVATLRYAAAIVLPKETTEALQIMSFSYRVMLLVCLLLVLFLWTYEGTQLSWNGIEMLGRWSWALPFAVFLMSSLHIQESWLTRNKSFKTLSASLFALSLGTHGSRIAIGAVAGSSATGLISGYFLGLLAQMLAQLNAARDGVRASFRNIDKATAKWIAGKYSDFPKFNAPAGLVFAMGQRLPVLLFGAMFSPSIAGLYAMADRVCQAPVTIVATSVRRVFLQKAADIENRGRNLRKAYLLSVGTLSLLGIIPFGILWFYGQTLAIWILGNDWRIAGQFMQIMAPWLFLVWVSAPCNSIFVVLRKQKFWLTLTTVITIMRLASFAIAHASSAGPEWALQAFVIASIIGNLFTLAVALTLVLRTSGTPPPPSNNRRSLPAVNNGA